MTAPSTRADRRTPLSRLATGLAAGLLAAGLLAGCAGDGAGDSASVAEVSAGRGSEGVDAPAPALDADAAGGAAEPAQQLVTTASIDVVVDDPVGAAQEISTLVEQAGGRTEQRTERVRTDSSEPRANLTVRVPSDKVTATIAALAEVGTVESTDIESTDVGARATDLDARIKALKASTARLEALMSTAATTADLIDAESTLTSRQGDLESLQAQRSSLADQVEMSTLTISLTTEPVTVDEEDGFLDGLRTGWDALVSTLATMVVVLGVILPWALVAAVVLVAARWVGRRQRRRHRMVRTPGGTGASGGSDESGAPVDERRASAPSR